jgi:hypothetical protein
MSVKVRIKDYPQLTKLCWNLPGVEELPGERVLAIYEERWRHVDQSALGAEERALIDLLAREHGGGHFCV